MLIILSKIGTIISSDSAKRHGKFDEKSSAPVAILDARKDVLKSICSMAEEPRSGSNPTPEILSQPMSFSTFSVSLFIDKRMPAISSSVNFDAKSSSISPKSSVSEVKHAGRINAADIIALEQFGRYPPIN
jgi:hypothetical protein